MTDELLRYDAFISYRDTEPDGTFARTLVKDLEDAGFSAAFDKRDFRGNEPFLDEIERCIRESRFTLAVVSPRYFENGNTQQEATIQTIRDMKERKRRLIPLIIEKSALPSWFGLLTGIDFTKSELLAPPFDKLRNNLSPPLAAAAGQSAPAFASAAAIAGQGPLPAFKFVYTLVTAKGFLDEELKALAPYQDLFDAADPADSANRGGAASEITAVLHFPDEKSLNSSLATRYTAVTAVCCRDPEQIAAAFLAAAPSRNGLYFEEKERLFTAISRALDGAFIVAVAVPPTFLRAGRRRPDIYYQAMCGVFLVPLVDLHRQLEIAKLHLRLQGVGGATGDLVELAKRVVTSAYRRKSSWSVDVMKSPPLAVVGEIAGHIGWAVERLYNSSRPDREKWVAYLQRRQ